MPITIEHISHTYSAGSPFEQAAIRDVSLTIGEGEFVGVIGHTGSGKSTLAECICGLIKLQSGSLSIDGLELNKPYEKSQLRGKVGMVFQYPEQQLFEDTVLKDVCFGPKNQGLSEAEQQERARWALALMGLDASFEGRSPLNLSGGEKRRVAMAGVLAMKPKYLLLDEPTVGLDPQGREDMLRVVQRLHDEEGMAVVMISHSMDVVASLADRIAVMHEGTVVRCGTPEMVFEDVDFLQSIGLDVPAMAKVRRALLARGWDLPLALEPRAMAQAIAQAKGGQADV